MDNADIMKKNIYVASDNSQTVAFVPMTKQNAGWGVPAAHIPHGHALPPLAIPLVGAAAAFALPLEAHVGDINSFSHDRLLRLMAFYNDTFEKYWLHIRRGKVAKCMVYNQIIEYRKKCLT
ncbi:hypothetical protein BC937DRAFT_87043 [Endogone sp. FLAS-F59071]|nr:hypothetical protein BC937DRAFT_87043 [Endogone sp. FLAS-F59071]|eukprot:RUS22773.1 hypothetical protein BC937DRAFT_87043 [Endogone sp. FLAS-F59071]